MPVLDSSFLIDLQRSRPAAVAALQPVAHLPLTIPMVVAKEFMAGFEEPLAVLRLLQQEYRVAPESPELAVAASRLYRRLHKAGARVPWHDVTIAAQAELETTYVITADARDFSRMGCRLWDYRRHAAPPEQP